MHTIIFNENVQQNSHFQRESVRYDFWLDFGGSYELLSTIRAVNPTEELRYGSRIKYVPTRVGPFDNDHSKAP